MTTWLFVGIVAVLALFSYAALRATVVEAVAQWAQARREAAARERRDQRKQAQREAAMAQVLQDLQRQDGEFTRRKAA